MREYRIPRNTLAFLMSFDARDSEKMVTDIQFDGIKAAAEQSCFVKLRSVTIF